MQSPVELGLQAACRLKDIEIAELHLKLARERYGHASLQIEFWTIKLEERKRISEGR